MGSGRTQNDKTCDGDVDLHKHITYDKGMLSTQELQEIGIYNWSDISNDFKESDILLGNGFSINITEKPNQTSKFRYPSIFDKFISNCPPEYRSIFPAFKTTNFEKIMQRLEGGLFINRLFGYDEDKIKEAINTLRSGLITTINSIHPSAEDIYWASLESIASQIRFFRNIYTINYELFLYHIIMLMKDEKDKNDLNRRKPGYQNLWQYSDCFWGPYDDEFNCFVSAQDPRNYRFVYYLHGALFLFSTSSIELKIMRKDRHIELIELIRSNINKGNLPLFVCEGENYKKKAEINNSYYLKHAYFNLNNRLADKLTIYGCSLSDQDLHIIEAIDKENLKLAISIHIAEKDTVTLQNEKRRVENKFRKSDLRFYDSTTLFKF